MQHFVCEITNFDLFWPKENHIVFKRQFVNNEIARFSFNILFLPTIKITWMNISRLNKGDRFLIKYVKYSCFIAVLLVILTLFNFKYANLLISKTGKQCLTISWPCQWSALFCGLKFIGNGFCFQIPNFYRCSTRYQEFKKKYRQYNFL